MIIYIKTNQQNKFNMIRKILFWAAMMPLTAAAGEAGDTTVVYQGKKFVIAADSTETKVGIYDYDGQKLTKTKESVYINGTEVERVFVGSPFTAERDLQTMEFRPALPTAWFGFNRLSEGNDYDKYPGTRRTGSFEIGVTLLTVAVPFDKAKTIGFTTGAQLVFARYNFADNIALRNSGGRIDFAECPSVTKNNMFFGALRIPLLLSFQTTDHSFDESFGISIEARTNAKYNFSSGSGMEGIPDGLRLNRFGVNLMGQITFGNVLTIGFMWGITPLFKTTTGNKISPASMGIGINLPGLLDIKRTITQKRKAAVRNL